jgi:hypothetical protein
MNTTPNPIRRLSRRLPLLAAASMLAPAILPGIAGAAPAPVKVFILAGQSNMVGHGKVEMGRDPAAAGKKAKEVKGGIGSLRYLVKNDPGKYGGLVDKKITGSYATMSGSGQPPTKAKKENSPSGLEQAVGSVPSSDSATSSETS